MKPSRKTVGSPDGKERLLETIQLLSLAVTVLLFLVISPVTSAATLTVGPGQTYPTLSAAVSAASSGDTLEVEPGTYAEHLAINIDLTIESDPSTTTALNPVIVDGSASGRVFIIGSMNNAPSVTLKGIVIQNGLSTGTTLNGGGIYNFGNLTVDRCMLRNNSATRHTGVGGIKNGPGGTLTVTNSSFIGNTAISSGGIYQAGNIMTITNSTFYNNRASNGAGAIASFGPTNLLNCTFLGNASLAQDKTVTVAVGVVTAKNCLFADNTGGNCTIDNDANGVTTTYTSLGHNLSDDGTCGTNGVNGDQIGVSDSTFALGSLQYNGGLTPTIALLSGSPAVDHGDNSGAPSTDQRGIPRIFHSTVDIGAYEFVNDANNLDCGYTYHVNGGAITDLAVTYTDADPFDGINTLQLVSATNDTQTLQFGSGAAQPISEGTTDGIPFEDRMGPVILTSTKSGTGNATEEVIVTDFEGKFANCVPPGIASIEVRQPGGYRQTFGNLSPEAGHVHLLNGDQGIDQLEVEANGRLFSLAGLSSGQSADLDLSSAMRSGDSNEVTITGTGPIGSQAFALIGDGTLVRTGDGGSTSTAGTSPLPGDVNGDGRVDVPDAILLLEAVVGERSLTTRELQAIGSTGNRPVTVADVVALLRKVVGE